MVDADERKHLKDFYSVDPVTGDDAVAFFAQLSALRSLEILVPMDRLEGNQSAQTEIRLRKLVESFGTSAVDYLLKVLEHGHSQIKQIAARCFAGVDRENGFVENELYRLSQSSKHSSIDIQRAAIAAQGFGGFVSYASTYVETALYGSVENRHSTCINPYFAEKLSYFTVQALIRSTKGIKDTDSIGNFLSGVVEIFQKAPKESSSITDWDFRAVIHHLNHRAADPLMNLWVRSDDSRLRRIGPEALGKLQLERMIGPLVDTMVAESDDSDCRDAAGMALCDYSNRRSVDQIASRLANSDIQSMPNFDWWLSSLYPFSNKWDVASRLTTEIANSSTESGAQMRYSLAVCGVVNIEMLMERLGDEDSFTRGAAALAIVRLLGEDAASLLAGRDRETSSHFEHAAVLAAQIHSGMVEQADALHDSLTFLSSLTILRRIWKREILSAFYFAEGKDSKRWRLWCEAAHACPKETIDEMKALLGPKFPATATMPDLPSTSSMTSSYQKDSSVVLKSTNDPMTTLPVIILITVNDHETDAVFDAFLGPSKTASTEARGGVDYSLLGIHGGHEVIHTICEMGASGLGASQQRTHQAITQWKPRAVIAVGIAFGIDETRQRIGDVLVSKQLQDYELGRVNADGSITPRGDKAACSPSLLNRLRTIDTNQRRSEAEWPKIRFGLLLSGQKLVDNLDYRTSLQTLAGGEAIGGEMEGGGLYASAQADKVDWIVIKAICDWGHKKNVSDKDEWQKMAAANAAKVVKVALDAGCIYK